MDDAFAGGVCRCQHCGAIQTVPSRLKQQQSGTVVDQKKSKTLYSKKVVRAGGGNGEGVPSSGLDQLAQVVASSGLRSQRLVRAKDVPRPKQQVKQQQPQQTLLLTGVAAIALVALGLGIYLALRTSPTSANPAQGGASAAGPSASAGPPTPVARTTSPEAEAAAAKLAAPHFCDVALNDHVVIYVLDRGSGTADLFSYLKEVVFKSVESLGSDRKYKIIFWNNGGSDDAFPSGAPTYATSQSLESARRALDGITAYGQTDVASALKQAVAASPDSIILATGKGWQLDDSFVDQVLKIRKDSQIKIHTFALGGSEPSAALKTISQKTGGESRLIDEGDLKRFAKE
ncbi:MAG TPA: hypothetical protein VH518_13310 [Tepidisphaeraceae bacterium]|jgi:hypothetical protein